jgi:tetratricopeptide (TPR) repeat protein
MKHFGFISVAALGLLCILTLAGCRQGAHYSADLLRADSVMDARPDSAYGIVARLRPDSLDAANRALLCLLTTQAKWKTDRDISNDTVWDAAIRHFTEQEDYDRLAKCYYYRGVVCKERKEVDRAMTNYLSAAENIEKTRDYYYNNLINSYIGHLYTDQMAYDKTYKYFTRAYRAAKAMNDSTGMAYALMDLSDYYDCRRQFQKTVTNAHKACMLIHCDTTDVLYLDIMNELSNAYWFLKDYKKSLHYALQILPIYSKDTVSDNGPHYATLAHSYLALKKYDEAEKYYQLSAKSTILQTRLVSYGCLRDICDVRGESRQAARYQTLVDSLMQEIYDQNKSDALVQAQSEYKTQELVNEVGNKSSFKIRGLVCALSAIVIIAMWTFFKRRQTRRQFIQEKDLLIAHAEKTNEQNQGLKNVIADIKDVHSLLAAGELPEARAFLQLMLDKPKKIRKWNRYDWGLIRRLVSEIDAQIVTDLSSMDNLNEHEKGICMLTILGFPLQTISEIYSMQVRSVSRLKSRIKNKIAEQCNGDSSFKWIYLLEYKKGRKK